jgi:F-type H+-transporting ATPase subunit b
MSINATLVVELVVFVAVLVVLARFVIRPLQTAMQRRQAEIDEALAKARRVEDLLAAAEADYAATLAGARQEAAEIIAAGRRVASFLEQENRAR